LKPEEAAKASIAETGNAFDPDLVYLFSQILRELSRTREEFADARDTE